MTFLHAAWLWGALLGGVPILIHLLSRRRYRVVRWAAMDFLLRAAAQRARSVQIQDLILLALRTLALVAAAIALSRPILTGRASAALASRGESEAAIVLDTSYSMQTLEGARTRMEAARQQALAVLEALPAGTRVSLFRADTVATPALETPTDDRAAIADAIARTEAGPGGSDASAGIAAAIDALRTSTASARTVYLLSDFQRRAWDANEREIRRRLDEADPAVRFVAWPVTQGPAPNAAITSLRVTSRLIAVARPVEFDADVIDAGQPPVEQVDVELWVADRKVSRQSVALSDGRATVTFRHIFRTAGPAPVEVRLGPDAVDADNHRYALLYVPESIGVAVLARTSGYGASGSAASGSSASAPGADYFVSAALSHGASDNEVSLPFQVERVNGAASLPSALSGDVACVILADSGALPAATLRALDRFARAGGGVLITAGPEAAATCGPLRQPPFAALAGVTVDVPAEDESPVHIAAGPGVASRVVDLDSPGLRHAVGTVTFWRTLGLSRADDAGLEADLQFDDGRPAALIGAYGAGRVALFAGSLDTAWCDLPYRPAFVPMLADWVAYLARGRLIAPERRPREAWTVPIDRSALSSSVAIVGSRGQKLDLAAALRSPATQAAGGSPTDGVSIGGFDEAGVYRLTGVSPEHAQLGVAINVDTAESSPDRLSADELRARLPAGRTVVLDGAADGASKSILAGVVGTDASRVVAAALVAMLMLETLLGYWFGRRRAAAAEGGR